MYAVIKTGGKQYRVSAGDVLTVEKLSGEPGQQVTFDHVLLLADGDGAVVGAPVVEGAAVTATLIETRKGEKVKIFKKIRRQGYRRTRGHRQMETVLRVTSIAGAGKESKFEGVVSLMTKLEINTRARGLATRQAEALNVDDTALDVIAPEATTAEVNVTDEAPQKNVTPKKAAPKKAKPADTDTQENLI
jgi:large subunit ribosomal protein L21